MQEKKEKGGKKGAAMHLNSFEAFRLLFVHALDSNPCARATGSWGEKEFPCTATIESSTVHWFKPTASKREKRTFPKKIKFIGQENTSGHFQRHAMKTMIEE